MTNRKIEIGDIWESDVAWGRVMEDWKIQIHFKHSGFSHYEPMTPHQSPNDQWYLRESSRVERIIKKYDN